jgi:hypothetical protein
MPLISRSQIRSSVIKNPPALPVPMYSGSVGCSLSFEGFPSASLEYTAIAQQDIAEIESAYEVGNKLSLYGIQFEVASYSYKREGHLIRDSIKFSTYSVQIELAGAYQKELEVEIPLRPLADRRGKVPISLIAKASGVPYSGLGFIADTKNRQASSLKGAVEAYSRINGCHISYINGIHLLPLSQGSTWNFPDTDVIDDGQNKLSASPVYNRAILTGGFTNTTVDDTGSPAQFQYEDAQTETIIEEDEDVTLPPRDSKVLKSLDSNFDITGPKKNKRATTQAWDQPDSEEEWTYGFAYTASDIADADNNLFSSNPNAFWKVVEYRKRTYIYKSLPPITLNVQASDPRDPSRKYPVLIHPDYEQFAQVGLLGGNITFSSTAAYLVEIVTTGWQLARLNKEGQREQGIYETTDSENPLYQYSFFKKIPTQAKTAYLLKSVRSQYGVNTTNPFSVEWVNLNDIDPRLKTKIDIYRNVNPQGQVAILTPDPNYVEPLFVSAESSQSNSFAYAPHPESTDDNFKEPLMTGEETYSSIRRTILGANKYREQVTEFSAKEAGFNLSLEQLRYKEALGRPPEAQYRIAKAEQIGNNSTASPSKVKTYCVFSDRNPKSFVSPGGSLNYPEAETINAALTAARCELQLNEMSASQCNKTVTWFYPAIRPGDRVSTGLDRFADKGAWKVMSTSWILNYQGSDNRFNCYPLVTCDGTQLTLGRYRDRRITYEVKEEPNTAGDATSGSVNIEAKGAVDYAMGGLLQNVSHRRSF